MLLQIVQWAICSILL